MPTDLGVDSISKAVKVEGFGVEAVHVFAIYQRISVYGLFGFAGIRRQLAYILTFDCVFAGARPEFLCDAVTVLVHESNVSVFHT